MSSRVPLRRPDTLTGREHEVLDLLRLGLTNEEIAGRLGISLDGAKYHVSQILSKLGVATREEASRVAEPAIRRWAWLGLPFAVKVAGGIVAVTAAAGVMVLALGVFNEAEEESRATDAGSGAGPRAGEDHWHAPISVYIGDEEQPVLPAFEGGMSTPGDGVIHIQPRTADEEGAAASLARFFANGGGELTGETLRLPGSTQTYQNGDLVPGDGNPGAVYVFVNGAPICTDSELRGDTIIAPADYVPHDGDRISIQFISPRELDDPCVQPD